jgi:hypothetical protein
VRALVARDAFRAILNFATGALGFDRLRAITPPSTMGTRSRLSTTSRA